MKLLSAIVPCYNEEDNIADFYQEFVKNDPFFKEKEIEFELWYIDDGSKDGTALEIKKLIEKDSRVHLLSFPEILERKRQSMQAWRSQRATMWFFWMWICRILLRFSLKCWAFWSRAMIRLLRGVSAAKENRLSGPFLQECFIG